MIQKLLLAGALTAAAVTGFACGGDDDANDDPRAAQVGAVSENATYAYADDGAAGLYDYLATDVTDKCTVEQVQADIKDEPAATGWRQTRDFKFDGDIATATVIVITAGGDADQEWSFVKEGDSWRITSVPGLEDCAG